MSEKLLRQLRSMSIEMREAKNSTQARIIDAAIIELSSREQLLRLLLPLMQDYQGVRRILIHSSTSSGTKEPEALASMIRTEGAVAQCLKAIEAVVAAAQIVKG
jgi:hypothetical protein